MNTPTNGHAVHLNAEMPTRGPRPSRPRAAHPGAGGVAGHRRLTIVVPAKNEEAAIGATLASLPLATLRTLGLEAEVVVLDGRSTDATVAIAKRWGATIITDREVGKGAALRNARNRIRGDYVVMLDADGTYPGDAVPRLVAPLLWNEADVVMGRRLPQKGSMAGLNKVGNLALCMGASLLYWQDCPDVCTGMWAFKGSAFRRLPLASRSFGLEAEIFALTSRLGYRLGHVDIDYLPRCDGSATKLHPARDGLRIARRLMRTRFARLQDPERDGAVPAAQPEGVA